MVFLGLIYRIPLSKNEEAIQKEISEIQGEIANSISHIVQNKFHNIMNELLLFNHHMTFLQRFSCIDQQNSCIFIEKQYKNNEYINH